MVVIFTWSKAFKCIQDPVFYFLHSNVSVTFWTNEFWNRSMPRILFTYLFFSNYASCMSRKTSHINIHKVFTTYMNTLNTIHFFFLPEDESRMDFYMDTK